LAHHFRPFYPVNTCPVLFRQEFRFCTVADRISERHCGWQATGQA
jgi:hypothetical protein